MGKVAAKALCRMGNQMFIAAAAATYARRTGREFAGLVYDYGRHRGEYPGQMLDGVMRHVRYMEPEAVKDFLCLPFNRQYYDGIPNPDAPDVLIDSFLQCNLHIDCDIAFEIFSPKKETMDEIRRLYGDLSGHVCVSVRRGDYLQAQRRGFRVISKETIEAILSEHFQDVPCIFVSDDIGWCKENFTGRRFSFADKPCSYGPEIDLYLQTVCRGNIISNSSFSWWGAYLNEHTEKVVCPWPWFDVSKKGETPGLLPESWIKWKT